MHLFSYFYQMYILNNFILKVYLYRLILKIKFQNFKNTLIIVLYNFKIHFFNTKQIEFKTNIFIKFL